MRYLILCLVISSTILVQFGVQFDTIYANIDSPRQQMEQGVPPDEIICKESLELVIRTTGSPACLYPNTIAKMIDREMILEHIGPTFVQQDDTDDPQSPVIPQSPLIPQSSNKTDTKSVDTTLVNTAPSSKMTVPIGSIVDFYINDQDFNTSHSGVDTVNTKHILEISIDDIIIESPSTLTETGPNTGVFHGRLNLPDTINGRSLDTNDIVIIRYFDESDRTGNTKTHTQWLILKNTFADIETRGNDSRLGHMFTLRLYDPDSNFDSRERDRISLDRLEFRTDRGIRTTLAHPSFAAQPPVMLETDLSTGIFEVNIKIPRYIDKEIIHIGDEYEIRYIDRYTPSNMAETIVFNGNIGLKK